MTGSTDIPFVLVAHPDGTYSFADTNARIVMEWVPLPDIIDYLEGRHDRLHPEQTPDELWAEAHPPAEPLLNFTLDGPTILKLAPGPNGRLTVRNDSGEILDDDVSARQVFEALSRA